ncbi:nucleotidyl transferase AbiEii/AbiGii toxin family protein [Oligoflexus tunisiensis]|uniref:nucleotidyl transferase AbiEii/AbiGii toxin family protein n=1 Tax=Oligoflexus tunisiensis TaxID=708132 RepID=UPI00159EFD60|nr:nucleotidyl transferase AbiEii/AbiGii toxin family protein [Oligoflexus tunisiensis]
METYGTIRTAQDEKNALKEILQKICLKGLHRHGFFEEAAFYGGTALRIMYGLERFSEDLDFCSLTMDSQFKWARYQTAVEQELRLYGFDARFEAKKDESDHIVGSAFVKQSTANGLLVIESRSRAQKSELLQVKLELDKSNPPGATFENKLLTQPEVFLIKTLDESSLFAGKMHAILARQFQNRVKGRDYFDLVFYIQKKIRLNMVYLEAKLRQSGHYTDAGSLSISRLREMFLEKISNVDFKKAQDDVRPFVGPTQASSVSAWSRELFQALAAELHAKE